MTARISFAYSFLDYPDPMNMCLNVFFSGCDFRCKNCSNPDLQLPSEKFTEYNLQDCVEMILAMSVKTKSDNICFIGGDPLSTYNREFVKELLKELATYEDFKICVYTGYDVEMVKLMQLTNFTYLKCGKYEHDLRTTSGKTSDYMQFASTNQELYNANFEKLSNNGLYTFEKGSETHV